jgi:hypothetical protein
LRSTVLELLARDGPISIHEHGREDGLSVDALFGDPVAAVRAAVAIRRRLLAEAARAERQSQASMAIAPSPERALELAVRAAAGEVLLDADTAAEIGEQIVAVRRGDLVEPVAVRERAELTQIDGSRARWRPKLEEVLALVGAAAGLAAWVALVGGFTMWARFQAAHIPAIEGIAVLPRNVLLAEGVRTLAVPILLGSVAAVLAYAAATTWSRRDRAQALRVAGEGLVKGLNAVGLSLVVSLVVLGGPLLFLIARYGFHERWWALLIVLLTLLAMGVLAAAVIKIAAAHWLALTVLAVVTVWSGIAGIVWEGASTRPRLDHATLALVGGSPSDVLFIAHTGDTVYVAKKDPRAGGACRIQVLPVSAVADLRIGVRGRSDFCPAGSGEPTAPGTVTRTITAPASTVTVSRGTVTLAPATVTVPAETVTAAPQPVTVTNVETVESPQPAGAHRVGGVWSIPIASVQPPVRLQISPPRYERAPLTNTRPLGVTFTITDTRGYVVEGASVFVAGSRSAYFRRTKDAMSREDGTARLVLRPTSRLPFGKGVRIALLVRAWNPAERRLGGVSTRRFVELILGRKP